MPESKACIFERVKRFRNKDEQTSRDCFRVMIPESETEPFWQSATHIFKNFHFDPTPISQNSDHQSLIFGLNSRARLC